MKELSPIPVYWILRLYKPKQLDALRAYQRDNKWPELEIPPYPPGFMIAPIILDTEEATRLMTKRPKGSRGGRA